ncbi:SDR family NAD(P)-dependent oxidoreductase, partial [Pseudoalteromonas sp. J010]|uniref:type I polyketide synthase n=1 Tax=Pseudoalteromonas sp. J010 TaxID=998465 RepID=UPI000F655708
MENLKSLYSALQSGEMTQQEVLDTIKGDAHSSTDASILFTPNWQTAAIRKVSHTPYHARHVMFCGFTDKLVAQCRAHLQKDEVSWQTYAGEEYAEAYTELAAQCFEYIKQQLSQSLTAPLLFQLVLPNNDYGRLMSGLSGMFKSVSEEHPHFFAQVLLVDEQVLASSLVSFINDELHAELDCEVKYTAGLRKIRQWHTQTVPQGLQTTFKEGGVYLITGGLGGIGQLFAQHILHTTAAAKVILTGRQADSAQIQQQLAGFAQHRDRLSYLQLDLSELANVRQQLNQLAQTTGALTGVLHCAGCNQDDYVIKKNQDSLRNVLQPKVQGLMHLDLATADLDLDFFALFSSVAARFGNAGQSDYAAANGFMDSYAQFRNRLSEQRARAGLTSAINWPLWQQGGMTIDPDILQTMYEEEGVAALPTEQGIAAFQFSLWQQQSNAMLLYGDSNKLTTLLASPQNNNIESTESQIVSENNSTYAPEASAQVSDSAVILAKLQSFLYQQLAAVLNLPKTQPSAKIPFEKLGIDSISSIKVIKQLEQHFGSLPKTLFFEYQNLVQMSEYFITQHAAQVAVLVANKEKPQPVTSSATPSPRTVKPKKPLTRKLIKPALKAEHQAGNNHITPAQLQAHSEQTINNVGESDIAIIGLSGRYPKAENITQYWENLRAGLDCITEVPKSRWDWQEYYSEDNTQPQGHSSRWGGFIDGVDEFDPRFFNISPREAIGIDPQERLFLQHAWMAAEDAGFTRARLQIPHQGDAAGQVGVYVGVMYGEYNLSGSLASIANRVSYALDLHGPSMTLDTMCSSSLTAIHLACQDLKQGRTDLAIAGGVNVTVHPSKYSMLSEDQFISSSGHCQSFGEGGDGYIPGEGVGAVILSRLSDAQQAGQHIYGVIKASVLNHGGKTNGYTVPNPQAQANAISRALTEAKVAPQHINYIEAHGTGTKLGDPIEIAALSKAFYQGVEAQH